MFPTWSEVLEVLVAAGLPPGREADGAAGPAGHPGVILAAPRLADPSRTRRATRASSSGGFACT